ncbi:MAG: amidinotransferase [Gammaproteobacteria bacterium]|nr:amidinotransferase [Gammaproteobacteria bacterium]
MAESQLASTVLMIRPVRFERNPLTAASNQFMEDPDALPQEQQEAAVREFDGLVAALRDAGVNVVVVEDTSQPHTPDSVFPNNWITMHADGRVVLYPMEAENRRTERRADIVDYLSDELGFLVTEVVDLTAYERDGHYLEGTGSMVLDRVNRIAYACSSSRTHFDPLGDFARRMNYEVVSFDAVDSDGVPIYHTNVLMSVGEEFAAICDASIARTDQRDAVLNRLRDTGHEIISLSYEQLHAFAGNMLELDSGDGEHVIAMSQQALQALDDEQLERLRSFGRIVSAPIDSIEQSAGGSVRCMLAEVHLPARDSEHT